MTLFAHCAVTFQMFTHISRFLYEFTYYTFFFHLALASLMLKINESKDYNESDGRDGTGNACRFWLCDGDIYRDCRHGWDRGTDDIGIHGPGM